MFPDSLVCQGISDVGLLLVGVLQGQDVAQVLHLLLQPRLIL